MNTTILTTLFDNLQACEAHIKTYISATQKQSENLLTEANIADLGRAAARLLVRECFRVTYSEMHYY